MLTVKWYFRFCLICNYLSKIIPALQSRCTRFRFGPLKEEQILPRLEHVCQEEDVTISEDGKKALMTLSQGDMRRVINVLQSCHMAFEDVTEDNVYTCTGHPLRADITNIVNWALNEDFTTAYNNIQTLKTEKGDFVPSVMFQSLLLILRIEPAGHPLWGPPLHTQAGAARPGQDSDPDQVGGVGGETDGRLQREDTARGLPGRLPGHPGDDQGGGSVSQNSLQLFNGPFNMNTTGI